MAENIVLDKEIIEKSKNAACKIEDSALRKRAYALNIAANAAEEYLQSKGFALNTKSGLYKIPALAQSLEIADIYVNNVRLDVRVTFDDKTFYIPKIQEKYDAQPCAYLVTKLDSALNDIKILGFVDAQSLEKQKNATEYYCYETAVLQPIDELKSFIFNAKPQNSIPTPEEIEKTKELAVSFVENSLSDSEKVYFIKNVVKYAACREILADMNDFDKVANQIANYEELLNDSTLSVLSGNIKEVDEALLANMATLENAEENFEETQNSDDSANLDVFDSPVDSSENDALDDEMVDLEMNSGLNMDENGEIPLLEELNEDEIAQKTPDEPEKDALEEVVEEKIEDSDTMTLENIEPETEALLEFKDEPEEEIIKPMGVISTDIIQETLDSTEMKEFESVETLDFQNVEENIFEESAPEEKIEEEFEEKNEEIDEFKLQFEEDEFSEFSKELPEENVTENSDDNEIELLQETEALTEASDDDESLKEDIFESDSINHLEETDEILLEHENSDDMLLEEFDEELSAPEIEQKTEISVEETPRKPFKLMLEGEEEENIEELQETDEIIEPEAVAEAEFKPEIELNFETEEITEEKTVYSSQEPIEMVYDDEDEAVSDVEGVSDDFENISDAKTEIFEENVEETQETQISDEVEHENSVNAEISEQNDDETQQNADDSQIQELLDDDLLALLASETEQVDTEQETSEQAQFPTEEGASDAVVNASADEEVLENTLSAEDEALDSQNFAQNENDESETIETLYDSHETAQNGEEKEFELAEEPVSEKTVNATKTIIVAGALLLVLAGGGAAAWFVNHAKTADNSALDTANQDGELFDFQNTAKSSDDDAAPALSQDINKSMTNSFSDKPAAITITKLSWQVSEKLASENSVKEYLQTTGKNIQIKLQNDLANAADINFNNSIKVSFEISPDNTLKGMQILESSGSDQIDEMVQRSIKETLKYISVPKLKDFKSDYFLTLIINF